MTNKDPQSAEEMKDNTEKLNRERFLFFEEVFGKAGIRDDIAERISEEICTDNRFIERLVDNLVSRGIFQPRGEIYERVTLCNLADVAFPKDFANQLERKRLTANNPEEWCRLGRLFAYAGDKDRAALCHRTGFGLMSQATPELLVSLAEGIDPKRDKAMVLGCIDRVAEIILTGDQALDNPDRHDLTSEDPAGCAVLLDRACQAAIQCKEPGRAASLARAATALFERCGLRHKLQNALGSLADALTDLEDFEGALRTVERRRLVLSAESDYMQVADCYKKMAALSEKLGNLENAGRYYELAIQVYESIIDPKNAALTAQLQGALFLRHGRLDDCVDAYERSIEIGSDLKDLVGYGQLGVAKAWEAMGNFSTAVKCTEAAVDCFHALEMNGLLANAKLECAYFSVLLGRFEKALEYLGESRNLAPSVSERGRYSQVEGLISLGQDKEMRALEKFRLAYMRFQTEEDIDESARMLIEIGHFLNLENNSRERQWFFNSLDILGELGPELTPRIDVLRSRIGKDGEMLQSLFSEAANSEWTLFKIEAAEAIAGWALDTSRPTLITRGVATALRTLAELINRLDKDDHASFSDTPLLHRIVSMAESVRDKLHEQGNVGETDSDATAKISPAFVIEGLLAAVGYQPPKKVEEEVAINEDSGDEKPAEEDLIATKNENADANSEEKTSSSASETTDSE